MDAGTDKTKPPYLSYKTFENFYRGLRESGIPDRIDRTVMSGQSGANQSYLISALKFFGLINEDGTPTQRLNELVSGKSEKEQLSKLIREKYPFIFSNGFNILAATEGQLADRFREQSLAGDTIRKAITFFIQAAEAAGIQISPHLRPRKASNVSQQGRRSGRKKRASIETTDTPQTPQTPQQSMQEMLLEKFPTFDPAWDADLKKQWFESFNDFMKSVKKAET